MQSMLEGYLSFARSEAEEDVGDLDISELFNKLQHDAELRGHSQVSSIQGKTHVTVRPKAFTRLITNLVSNAWRYADHVEIRAHNGRSWLTVTVNDDGPGIPSDMREEVFKPFFRLDEARNQDKSGTGLGLAIARDIARSHGGDITLSDSPLGGLQATVRVPASKRRTPSATGLSIAARTTSPSPSGKPSTSTSDMNGPIWRGGKLTTAMTCRPTSVSACSVR